MFIVSGRRGEGTMVEGSATTTRHDHRLLTTAHGQGLVEIGFELMSHEG